MASGQNLYMIEGYEFKFKRDPVDGVDQPWIDLGTVKSVSENPSSQKVELYDGRGGKLNKVAQRLIKQDEVYNVELNNVSLRNRALFLSANPPEAYTQAAGAVVGISHIAHVGHLLKIVNSDGDPIYNLTSVDHVTNANRRAIAAVNVGSKTFSIVGNHATELNVAGGKITVFNCTGMSPTTQQLTIVSATFNTPNTDIVVSEAITGATVAGTLARSWLKNTDWEDVNMMQGWIRIMPESTMTDLATLLIDYTTAEIDSEKILPQTGGASIEGESLMVVGDNNYETVLIRHCRVSITPGGKSGGNEEFSALGVEIAVLNELGALIPAGELVQVAGDLPDLS